VASQSFLKVRFFRAVQGIIRDECLHLVTNGSGSLSFGTFAKTVFLGKRGGMKRRQLEKKAASTSRRQWRNLPGHKIRIDFLQQLENRQKSNAIIN
jgi:hypothetical protein